MPKRFSVIPVLDLKAGETVHARAGDRARYMPISTPLASSSAPEAVLAGLMTLAPFRRVYIADLDAIAGQGGNRAAVEALARAHPEMELWLDAGGRSAAGARIRPVIGSESLAALDELAPHAGGAGDAEPVLSLDYRGEDFVGPPGLAESPERWPENIIVMTLARVGTSSGPDFARLAAIKGLAGARAVWAAGGVRGDADLERLAAMDLAGVLVATALHDGRLSREALATFA